MQNFVTFKDICKWDLLPLSTVKNLVHCLPGWKTNQPTLAVTALLFNVFFFFFSLQVSWPSITECYPGSSRVIPAWSLNVFLDQLDHEHDMSRARSNLPYSDKRTQLLKITFLVNEQNVSVMYIEINAISSWLKYLSAGWVFLLQTWNEVEYAPSSIYETSLSQFWVICQLLLLSEWGSNNVKGFVGRVVSGFDVARSVLEI